MKKVIHGFHDGIKWTRM